MRGEVDLRGEVSHEAKECESMRGDVRKLKGEWKRDVRAQEQVIQYRCQKLEHRKRNNY